MEGQTGPKESHTRAFVVNMSMLFCNGKNVKGGYEQNAIVMNNLNRYEK